MNKISMVLALAVVAALLAACNTMPWQKKSADAEPVAELSPLDNPASETPPIVSEPGLPLSPDRRFKDLPLPVGLTEDPDRSYVFQSATLEIGRMVYLSRDTVNDLAQFFVRECPTEGWRLEKVLEAEGKVLSFQKPGKRLEVQVKAMGVGRSRRVVLTLTPDEGSGSSL